VCSSAGESLEIF